MDDDPYAYAPYVCPGCFAVGGRPCAPDCIDAAIDREHEEAMNRGDYERFDEDDDCIRDDCTECDCSRCVEREDEFAREQGWDGEGGGR